MILPVPPNPDHRSPQAARPAAAAHGGADFKAALEQERLPAGDREIDPSDLGTAIVAALPAKDVRIAVEPLRTVPTVSDADAALAGQANVGRDLLAAARRDDTSEGSASRSVAQQFNEQGWFAGTISAALTDSPVGVVAPALRADGPLTVAIGPVGVADDSEPGLVSARSSPTPTPDVPLAIATDVPARPQASLGQGGFAPAHPIASPLTTVVDAGEPVEAVPVARHTKPFLGTPNAVAVAVRAMEGGVAVTAHSANLDPQQRSKLRRAIEAILAEHGIPLGTVTILGRGKRQ